MQRLTLSQGPGADAAIPAYQTGAQEKVRTKRGRAHEAAWISWLQGEMAIGGAG